VSDSSTAAFISYSRTDSDFVMRLTEDLKAAGARVWLDQVDILPGEHWDHAVEGALEGSPLMLVILSSTSVSSMNVMDEVSFALEKQKTVIPVIIQDCTIPFRLRRIQYADFRADYARGINSLLRHLSAHSSQPAELLAPGLAGDAVEKPQPTPPEAPSEAEQRELAEVQRQAAAEAQAAEVLATELRGQEQARQAASLAEEAARKDLAQAQAQAEQAARAAEETARKAALERQAQQDAERREREDQAARQNAAREQEARELAERTAQEATRAEAAIAVAQPPTVAPIPQPHPQTHPVAPTQHATAAAVAYLTIIPAIVLLLVKPYSRIPLVRFHAYQSIQLNLAWLLAMAIGAWVNIYLCLLLALALVVAWAVAIVNAGKGKFYRLPIIGNFATKHSNI
jgi:uncharacterized membrane protein